MPLLLSKKNTPLFIAPITIFCLTFLFSASATASASTEGKFYGAKMTEYPEWFKESFLDIKEDIAEAAEAGKRLAIFFHQDGCPYCNALVERNLAQKDILEKAKKNFDFVDLNMWGDREVTYVNGKKYKEKELAAALKVQFTPTLMFYDEKGNIVLRLNGYRSPTKFMTDMDYVIATKSKNINYRDFVKTSVKKAANKELNKQEFFQPEPYNLRQYKDAGKLHAVIFEQKDCPDCDTMHNKVMPDKTLRGIMDQFKIVQLDMWSSKTKVTTPAGKTTTARDWANELDIKFAPSIVVFNEKGEEVIRTEGQFKVFHTQGIFDYVLSGAYKKQPSFQRYLTDRADHIREQGKDVDIWNYADQKPGERKL